jgi:hypothetical protein
MRSLQCFTYINKYSQKYSRPRKRNPTPNPLPARGEGATKKERKNSYFFIFEFRQA